MNPLKKMSIRSIGGSTPSAQPNQTMQKRKSLGAALAQKNAGLFFDFLTAQGNKNVEKLLLKYNKSEDHDEVVILSDTIVKINERNKPQERIIIITNKALYNILPGTDFGKCKRRIPLALLDGITVSEASGEFVIHVPAEYDYRLVSLRKAELLSVLEKATLELTGSPLTVHKSPSLVLQTKHKQKSVFSFNFRLPRMSVVSESAELEKEAKEVANTKATDWAHEDIESEVGPNDFNLLKVIGRGSFGKVMLVTRKGQENKVFAMKVLVKAAIIEKNQVEHTIAEREILETINHPFLMTLHYAFQTKEKLYLVMDYLRGGELFFHLKNERRFNESRSRLYCAEIMMALGHLHEKKIIYRDLKPENILLDSDGHLRLTDFGLSKKYVEGVQNLTFCGTPEYLAPEIVLDIPHDKEVDWWSLGILLYEMLVGLPPFYSENQATIYDMIVKLPLKLPNFLSEPAKSLISQLLQKQPDQRIGAGPEDWLKIKVHPFFAPIDFEALYRREIKPDFIPRTVGKTDTSNFDTEFTNEPVHDSVVAVKEGSSSAANSTAKDEFANFDYNKKQSLASKTSSASSTSS